MKHRGYTLVELLVVVAIIAMLAAMIAPVLMQAKDAARMRTCMSNMKQLGVAVTRYMDDHSGYGLPQPPAEYRNPWVLCVKPLIPGYLGMKALSSGEQPTLDESIKRVSFFKPPKRIWICDGDTVKGNATNESDKPYWWNFGSSYLYPGPSAYMQGENEFAKIIPAPCPRKPMQWKSPKRDILLADYWFDFHSGIRVPRETMSLTPKPWVDRLETKSINILFLDLHAKACSAAERKEFLLYTREDDNPYYNPQKP